MLYNKTTNTLNPTTTHSILKLLKNINHHLNLTILLITHKINIIKHIYNYITIINNNKLIKQNTINKIFSHPKTPLTQKFIQSTLHLNIPKNYQKHLQTKPFTNYIPILHLKFTNQSINTPLLSKTTHHFNINNNIINTQINYTNNIKFNIILTKIHNTQQNTQTTIT